LSWSPKANFLVAGSWDSKIRCWEITDSGACNPKLLVDYGSPVLTSCWHDDGANVFVGGCDNKAHLWDLNRNALHPIASHEQPVKYVHWLSQHNILITGSWDKTLKYWDGRSPNPVATVSLPDKLYSATEHNNIVAIAMAERHVHVYNMANPSLPFKTLQSPLKFQSRCIASFTQGLAGFALGSIEGRVAIHYYENENSNFAFKCHRVRDIIHAVNGIDFHPRGTFVTCGSDGGASFWDKESKQRLKQFALCPGPVTACKFNKPGTLLAYSTGYDWSSGVNGFSPSIKPSIFVHKIAGPEVEPKGTHGGGFKT